MQLGRLAKLTGILALCAGAEFSVADTVAAVWKPQKVSFYYFGRTSRYTCDGLRDKMRVMLLDMGARRDLSITTHGCEISGRRLDLPGLNPGLSIVFNAPAVRAADEKPGGAEPGVDAQYQPFVFMQDAFRNFEVGDCELIEEFSRQILPKFSTRGVKQDISCIPYQVSGNRYLIRGEVLKALPVIRTQ